ncbi:MAG: hypothetical protein IKL37_02085 [Alphaproteobacteria bacterium]|nr:hypothetical protein [Alphaproteobacteria bacterium]
MNAIVMTEEYWVNSMLSIARYYGKIAVDGFDYVVVDKRGHDIFECSREAQKAGRGKAIKPGEPCDLCRVDFVPIYRKLGREQFLKFLQENPDVYSVKKAKERLKQWQSKPND